MRIIARTALRKFWETYPDAEQPLKAWFDEASRLKWDSPANIKSTYRNASIIANNRVVFNIKIDRLLSNLEIDWLASRNQEFIDGWMTGIEIGGGYTPVADEEYFVYGNEQDSTLIRNEYLQTALEIGGDLNQGLLLLNPQIVSENGEWEAWFFANWLPGAHRYRSFYELMLDLHRRLLELPKLRLIPNS